MDFGIIERNVKRMQDILIELLNTIHNDNGWDDDIHDSFSKYARSVEKKTEQMKKIYDVAQRAEEDCEALSMSIDACNALIEEANSV